MIDAGKIAHEDFPEHAIQVVQTTDRDAIKELLSLTQYVDLCMPRGGEGLIRAVAENSKVPVIKHYKGVCHVFVDADADFKMAEEMYRDLRLIKRIADPESSVDRRYVTALAGKVACSSTETPIEYKAPPKGATPIATQRRSIYFEPNSAKMGLDSRAVVDEIGNMMRAYENTVVDIEGNTDSTGSPAGETFPA